MSSNTPPDRNLDLPAAQAMDPKAIPLYVDDRPAAGVFRVHCDAFDDPLELPN